MRRWLQLGAASAGMGAALVGWSLVGSQIGVAGADGGAGSSSSVSSSNGGTGTAKPRARVDTRSTPPRKPNRTDASSRVTSRSNRVTVAETPSAAGRLTSTTTVTSRVVTAAQNAPAPKVVVAASRSDPLGALGKFLTSTLKELFNRKTTLNPLQRLDDLSPKQKSLLDLIPKIQVPKENTLWYREVQAREAERQLLADENKRRMAEIIQNGVRLTDRDGRSVYSVDGKVFVRYTVTSFSIGPQGRVDGPLEPRLFTLSDRSSQRNRDAMIRSILKLDPAQVRSTWPR
ncbi:hypothetical protein FHT40_004979 [Mycolicibacterium sp. BK556]|uniref:hypothetical protein n=1 Tax=unclassified Mycolicibacterium TaxID=2636767 RepID=UPI001611A40E|nr:MULTISPECIES: hypothetical protein [unclassified Mycolicibacterium]MBB3605295.1 hypothetical protein [Mycolicibacterium sp. BK556]MBB3635491.1 hypothetical protein [Mycolicibacterium sp. BK607]